jgi:hypothetical protein
MKRIITLYLLILVLIVTLILIVVYQRNDQMSMIHWVELIWVEILAQSIYTKLVEKKL